MPTKVLADGLVAGAAAARAKTKVSGSQALIARLTLRIETSKRLI